MPCDYSAWQSRAVKDPRRGRKSDVAITSGLHREHRNHAAPSQKQRYNNIIIIIITIDSVNSKT